MIKVAIVDDQKLFRSSFSLLLAQIEEVEVVFRCSNGIALFEALKRKPIDLVFLDIQMPLMDGYQVACLLERYYPLIKVVVLSRSTDFYSIKRMLNYPIKGYLTKNIAFSKLKTAIFCVYHGGVYYDRQVRPFVKQIVEQSIDPTIVLTPREVEIIRLYAMQYNVKQIADQLHLSVRTIEKYKENLMQKTEADNFIGVILFALRWHYIEDSELTQGKHDKNTEK